MALTQLLQTSLQQNSLLWVMLAAFLGGVLSSILPCAVSFLPLTVAYMGGASSADASEATLSDHPRLSRSTLWLRPLLFVLGLCTALTVLGLMAALLGVSLGTALNGWAFMALGGLSVAMGLQLWGLWHMPAMPGLSRLPSVPTGALGAFVLGTVFGLTASPCATPILTVLLAYTASTKQPLMGGVALFCYALGQSLLLLLAGWGASVVKYRANLLKMGVWLNRLSGTILVGLGITWIVQGWPH
jgi:cytochrome c-type biogenesis protein